MKDNVHPRVQERYCDKAIKKTLTYSAVFKYPMSFNQLATFLISQHKFDYSTFVKSIHRLLKKRHIRVSKRKFYIGSYKPVSWGTRAKDTKTILSKNMWAIKLLNNIPWIRMVAITGSVAAYNAERGDDIDLFIITQGNRLWLTRGFTTLLLTIVGKYAVGKNNKEKLCCNIFIDEYNLKWPSNSNNLFVAHDILAMHPVINRENTYLKFINANKWVFGYFGNSNVELVKRHPKSRKGNTLGNILDKLAMKAQLSYMNKKRTTEVTERNFLHFNKHDHTKTVLGNFKKLLEQY